MPDESYESYRQLVATDLLGRGFSRDLVAFLTKDVRDEHAAGLPAGEAASMLTAAARAAVAFLNLKES